MNIRVYSALERHRGGLLRLLRLYVISIDKLDHIRNAALQNLAQRVQRIRRHRLARFQTANRGTADFPLYLQGIRGGAAAFDRFP